MPVEVLVRIFKCLPNHDIRCRISLACQKFYKICLDKSLVPVKDLCIYGHIVGRKSKKKTDQYSLSLEEIDSVLDIISQSKNLTSLKIKALGRNHVPNLRPHPVDELVSMALQSCPKLTHLEIIEPDYMASEYFESRIAFLAFTLGVMLIYYDIHIPDLLLNYQLWCTIKEHAALTYYLFVMIIID